MKADPKHIIEEAMSLPPNTRAKIAEALLETLDHDEDFKISDEWLQEISRRCEQIDTGTAELIEGDAAIAELRGKYS